MRFASDLRFVSLLEESGDGFNGRMGDGETRRTIAVVKVATGDRDDQPFGIQQIRNSEEGVVHGMVFIKTKRGLHILYTQTESIKKHEELLWFSDENWDFSCELKMCRSAKASESHDPPP